MPTGYTAKLMDEGQSFHDFAMTCAKAFGACIMLRDDPLDAPIPDKFDASDYHVKALYEARGEVARLTAMTNEERIAFGLARKQSEIARSEKSLEHDRAQNARIEAMQAKVSAWVAPTKDHVGLKEFMAEQLKISLHDTLWTIGHIGECAEKSPMDFFNTALSDGERYVSYHANGQGEEVARANDRTAWVRQLRESLK